MLLVFKPQAVDRLIVLKKEYYRVKFVCTRIDRERTHNVLILVSWEEVSSAWTKCTRVGNVYGITVLLVLKKQVVNRLIVLEKEYYRVRCVGTRIDKEKTPTVLILDSWEEVSWLCTKYTRVGNV